MLYRKFFTFLVVLFLSSPAAIADVSVAYVDTARLLQDCLLYTSDAADES